MAQVGCHGVATRRPHQERPDAHTGSCQTSTGQRRDVTSDVLLGVRRLAGWSDATGGPRTVVRMARIGFTSPPRTFADDLRARSDDQLAALLRARPDLVTPVPVDI